MQFGVQASIHMASSVNLIPTKGMTLPFISYGGSSLLASGLTIGLILALTRKRIGQSYTLPSDRPTSNRRERGAA
jgi:cell division protein FtsW